MGILNCRRPTLKRFASGHRVARVGIHSHCGFTSVAEISSLSSEERRGSTSFDVGSNWLGLILMDVRAELVMQAIVV